MADYWPKAEGEDLWCSMATIIGHTALSERTVFRALSELKAKDFIVQTQASSQYRSPRYTPVIPQGCHTVTPGPATQSPPEVSDWHPTLDRTPYLNPYPASPMAAPARRAAPTSSSPTKKRMTRTEDIALWHEILETQHADCSKAELIEIYDHWNTRYNWPGCFARDMRDKGNLDGFLGGAGIDLGLYDEPAEADDPWATSA